MSFILRWPCIGVCLLLVSVNERTKQPGMFHLICRATLDQAKHHETLRIEFKQAGEIDSYVLS
jgi:hypothetical protein